MWKHGTTVSGKIRWYCKDCKKSSIKKRTDVTFRSWDAIVRRWLVEGLKLRTIAKEKGLHLRYLQSKCTETLRRIVPGTHSTILDSKKPLVLDGTWIVWKKIVVLIASDTERVVHWKFTFIENTETCTTFLCELSGQPNGIVSDAQKGLLNAVSRRFGDIPHQRCIAHIVRQARLWLTRHPKTMAGAGLLVLVNNLGKVHTYEFEQLWRQKYHSWCMEWHDFLKERTYFENSKRWWYTHRRLRGVRSLLSHALPNMFIHIRHVVPNTTNALEGGINSPLKFVFKEHRGLSVENKKALVNLFLNERTKRKNQH